MVSSREAAVSSLTSLIKVEHCTEIFTQQALGLYLDTVPVTLRNSTT
jgi:hypothetical protein